MPALHRRLSRGDDRGSQRDAAGRPAPDPDRDHVLAGTRRRRAARLPQRTSTTRSATPAGYWAEDRIRQRHTPTLGTDRLGGVAEGEDRRLYPVPEAELRQDAADVRLDGLLADVEAAGDLPVAATAGDQFEHLALPRGQALQRIGGRLVAQCPGEAAEQLGADRGGTGGGVTDAGDDLIGARSLQQVRR